METQKHWDRSLLHRGMEVHSLDGKDLGKIADFTSDRLIIEKGWFFPKECVARLDDIAEVREDEVYLGVTSDALREMTERTSDLNASSGLMADAQNEIRVPVVEEEIHTEVRSQEAGEVLIHKTVTTEHRHIDVPVRHEEVRIERVPVSDEAATASRETMGANDETIRIPVREEIVEVTKRPVVREEVRVSKATLTDSERVDEEVQKEHVEIEQKGEIHATEKSRSRK
jgi:uncharacterized protein (TIGR02271 family)